MFQRVQAAKRAADHLNQDQLQQQQQQQQYDDAPNTPLVFQCANCRTIVGDSLSLGDADEAAQTISLSSASHVRKLNQVYTPHSGRDVGSSYFPIVCAQCQAQLGKFYITTLRTLDHLREKYTFNIAALTSYALGQSEQGFNAAEAVNDAIEGPGPDEAEELAEGLATKVDELSEEVVKIEHVMLSLTERVQTIEQRLAIPYTATVATPTRLETPPMATPTATTAAHVPMVRPVPERRNGSAESKRQRIRS